MANNSVGNVAVGIIANGTQATQEFGKVEARAAQFGKSMSSLGGVASAGLGPLTAAVAAGSLLADGLSGLGKMALDTGVSSLKMAADFEQSQTAFTTMLKDGDKATKLLGDLQKLAVSTPYNSTDLIAAGKTLVTFGTSAEQVVPTLSRIGDVAGSSAENVSEMARAFGRVKASGKFQLEDLNIFTERGADIDAFAKANGGDVQKLYADITKGAVGFSVLANGLNLMTEAGGRFYQGNIKQSQTLAGQWSNLTESFDLLKLSLGQAFIAGFKPGELLGQASEGIDGLKSRAKELEPIFGNARVAFDGVLLTGRAIGSVLGDKLSDSFDKSGKGAEGFGATVDRVVDAALIGFGTLLDSIDDMTGGLKATAKLGASLLRTFGGSPAGEGSNSDALVGGIVGNSLRDAAGLALPVDKFAESQKNALEAAKLLDGVADKLDKGIFGKGNAQRLLDKKNGLLGTGEGGGDWGDGPGDVPLIDGAGKLGMSSGAKDWLGSLSNAQGAKGLSDFEEFQRLMGFRNEVAKFEPGKLGIADDALARSLLKFEGAVQTLEYKLPEALYAGSAEAYSAVANSLSGGGRESGEDRLARIMDQVKMKHDEEISLLREIKTALAARPGGLKYP